MHVGFETDVTGARAGDEADAGALGTLLHPTAAQASTTASSQTSVLSTGAIGARRKARSSAGRGGRSSCNESDERFHIECLVLRPGSDVDSMAPV
jgi:hypothetical protein